MRFSIVTLTAFAAGAYATYGNTTIYTTEVVTAYTTYCPAATSIVHGSQTYVVTEATTLTITNCPCTVTKPLITSTATYCPTCPGVSTSVAAIPYSTTSAAGVPYSSSTGAAIPYSSSVAPYSYSNSTTPVVGPTAPPTTTVASTGIVPSSTGAALPTFTGAATKNGFAAGGASLVGLLGLVAYVL